MNKIATLCNLILSDYQSLKDRLENLENCIDNLILDMARYEENAPLPNQQWTDERLKALELQLKDLRK